METGWIDMVMQVNADIVATEAHFSEQVARLVEVSSAGDDTTGDEELLAAHANKLSVLRLIRDRFLDGLTPLP